MKKIIGLILILPMICLLGYLMWDTLKDPDGRMMLFIFISFLGLTIVTGIGLSLLFGG